MGGAMPGGAQPSPPPAPAPKDARGPADRSHADETGEGDRRELQQPSPCENACRALASMKRAADAICRLAGSGDARCTDAQRKVESSVSRVAVCGCS
jgi:hypothetical protein